MIFYGCEIITIQYVDWFRVKAGGIGQISQDMMELGQVEVLRPQTTVQQKRKGKSCVSRFGPLTPDGLLYTGTHCHFVGNKQCKDCTLVK